MKAFFLFATVAAGPAMALSSLPSTWNEFRQVHEDMENLFTAFKNRFNKLYKSPEEERERFQIFRSRVQHIFDFNEGSKRTYTKGITRYPVHCIQQMSCVFKGLAQVRRYGWKHEKKLCYARDSGFEGTLIVLLCCFVYLCICEHLQPSTGAKTSLKATAPKFKTLANVGDSSSCDLRKFATSIKDQSSCGTEYLFHVTAVHLCLLD